MTIAKLELPEPWYWTNDELSLQLQKEINSSHILYSIKTKTLARRQDNDDVLFEVMDQAFGYAIVHLTWSSEKQKDSHWPQTELFKDWTDLYNNRILKDKEDFEKLN